MSAAMDNLESLDNKALRQKCLEYGLPNIPITDTSRKLFIKRLRNAMGGGPKTIQKQKARRDTSNEKITPKTPMKSKVTSRKTIRTSNLSKKDPSEPARATVTQRRRSGRTTAISQLEPVTSHPVKRKTFHIIEEDDEDSIQIPVIVEKSTEPSRQGRAPSLSKSIVVTTSYAPEKVVELEDTNLEVVNEEDVLELESGRYKYVSSSREYETSKPFSMPLEGAATVKYPAGRISEGAPRISLGKTPITTASYETSATRRYTTGGYKSATDRNENKTFAHHFNETKEDNIESPYLSDFVRRLSKLKADPLTTGISSARKAEAPVRKTSNYYETSVNCRRGTKQRKV